MGGFFLSLSSCPVIFFLLTILPASRSQGFTYHQRIPSISATTVNPAQYAGAVENTQLRKALTKTHGVLMIVAWPVLAGTAVLFAAFLKPVLKEGKWFQVRHVLSRGLVSRLKLTQYPLFSHLLTFPSSHPQLHFPPSLHSSFSSPSFPTSFFPSRSSTGTSCHYAHLSSGGGVCLYLDFHCTQGQHTCWTHCSH